MNYRKERIIGIKIVKSQQGIWDNKFLNTRAASAPFCLNAFKMVV